MKQKNGLCRRSSLGSLKVASCRQGLGLDAGNQEAGVARAGLEQELAMEAKKAGEGGLYLVCCANTGRPACTHCSKIICAQKQNHLSHVMSKTL